MNILKGVFGGDGTASVSAAEAKARLDGAEPPFVLDVRQPAEFNAGHIRGAHHIPLDELNARLSEVPKERTILCVCLSGARSGTAARMLTNAGYRAVNLSGGVLSWQTSGFPLTT